MIIVSVKVKTVATDFEMTYSDRVDNFKEALYYIKDLMNKDDIKVLDFCWEELKWAMFL